jgi:nucleotide-binding universal stress UspA family protein
VLSPDGAAAPGVEDQDMFNRILIGIDGDDGGRDALALAQRLAAPTAELVLAHVWDPAAGIAAAAAGGEHPAAAAHAILEEARATLPSPCRVVAHPASSPGAGLHQVAEDVACDLLVVGSSRHKDAGRTGLPHSLRAALHAGPCAIAVAPRGYAAAAGAVTAVGFGYVESRLGDHALEEARRLAGELGATLHVLAVVPPLPSPWMGGPFAYVAVFDDIMGRTVREAREHLEARGDFHVLVQKGAPEARLQAFSSDVDLLVLGSRAYGPVRRLLLGSTSDAVLQDAACPLLILPRPLLAKQPVEALAAPATADR